MHQAREPSHRSKQNRPGGVGDTEGSAVRCQGAKGPECTEPPGEMQASQKVCMCTRLHIVGYVRVQAQSREQGPERE